MKPRLALFAVLFALINLLSGNAFALTQAKISSSFANTINALGNVYVSNGTVAGKTSYYMAYSSTINTILSPFGKVLNVNSDHTSLTDWSDYNAGTIGQCVGLVRASNSSIPGTSSWVKYNSNNVTVSSAVSGDIIGTFNGSSYSGHTAIVVQVATDGLWVMDQNWSGQYIMLHFINTSGSNVGNLQNYYLVGY